MAKRVKKTNKSKSTKFEREFVAFGNRKEVFWPITIGTIILTIIGIPFMILDKTLLMRFLIIWILEIIYIWMYVMWKRKAKK